MTNTDKIISKPTLVIQIIAFVAVIIVFVFKFNSGPINQIWSYLAVVPVIPSFLLFIVITLKENGYINRKRIIKGLFMSCLPAVNIVYILIEGFYLLVDLWNGSEWLTESIAGEKPEELKKDIANEKDNRD